VGFAFYLSDANVVGYLTLPDQGDAVRATRGQLTRLLGTILYPDGPPAIISHDKDWLQRIRDRAKDAMGSLGIPYPERDQEVLEPDEVRAVLEPLKKEIQSRNYRFYALAAASPGSSPGEWGRVSDYAQKLAYQSGPYGLVLIAAPDTLLEGGVRVLDPYPFMSLLLDRALASSGMVFWSTSGPARFVPLGGLPEFTGSVLDSAKQGAQAVSGFLRDWKSARESVDAAPKKLLHLSDLHFGTEFAARNEALLTTHLDSVLPTVGRVVVTGDLCQDPEERDFLSFNNFRLYLARGHRKDPILIPGNHDQKDSGFLWSNFRQVARLEWSNLVVDDELRTVFLCFDSSRDATGANGRVSPDQLRELAVELDRHCNREARIKEYSRVALIHHHPYSFTPEKEKAVQRKTLFQRFLALFGQTDEPLLRMDDSEHFVAWCARRDVPLILHGHKHVQRHVEEKVTFLEGNRAVSRQITAVGCGTSLGTEDLPLSYNLVSWDPTRRYWSVAFYADPGDGSGFTEQAIAIHTAGPMAPAPA
jgi:3',5'-cyclic AMP phosphodiesterase CpdA